MQYEMLSERIGINLEVRLQSSDTDEGFLHVSNDLDKCSFPASTLSLDQKAIQRHILA